ncbi:MULTISPECIES: ribulose-phosphate 3-epimerase [unclassified Siphonobacter]|uniref:ribulose-phosphate 3-epimerase n=1 Tax=unclassified Siphonobacter TaxID=2635712 RepID=UPI000CB9880A|nr:MULTISPECIES: ribulose-phosphate 3-epimerase [unclassified Siphonobacter]MDQ1088843.1 ribulose-phosphate 3-epimerase [Siphonobacter sp. SORGH_AS_1065]MDR6195029.1 ribulose-phosphate 3-epimerase [Siphonobacter sp. SORGH_AS_0500]PKK38432.1 ribulose-phosphate 3-epimerase [Siphonobacter sp. SORGH_AS_0500]
MKTPLIAPSVLASDFANLQREIEMLNRSEADWIHFDVMDGVFVPNISFGIPVLEAVKKYAQKPIDVHLMITQPERYIETFQKAGADVITVHYEACTHLHRTIQQIKDTGCKAGVALNPHTPVELLENVLEDLDMVLIMSVNPGFGGQKFINRTFQKLNQLSEMRETLNKDLLIEVDGGVNASNAKKLLEHGVNVLVAGNFVFSSENPEQTIAELKK